MKKLCPVAAHFTIIALFSFAGGFAALAVFLPQAVLAQDSGNENFMALTDAKNRKGVNIFVNDGQPGQILYGENGQMAVQMGTYAGAGERGLPLIGLSDTQNRLRLLMRLAGDNQSPVIIMKDTSGRDRLVMGLALSDDGQEPFLSITDKNGKKQKVFGDF